MRLASAATAFLIVLLALTPLEATAAPVVTHSKISCVPASGNALVTANITSSSPVISARLYFRSAVKSSGDYYLELRKGNAGTYWAVLPLPLPETTAVNYRILVKDANGAETGTETYLVPTSGSCPVTLTPEETRYANNLVIGLTSDSQSPVPDGFQCKGVVIKITVAGELMPNEECRKVLAAAAGAAGTVVSTAGWIAAGAGAAALAGGGVAIGLNNADCKCPPSPCIPCPTTSSSSGNK